jgi:oligoribonuclease NrnB/cAMP/cGMP phosphodiesterase (DHH superfamily)
MKPIVLYHDACTDGFGAAWSFWTKYKDKYEYLAVRYGDTPPDVTGRDVYLVDFSYKREVVIELLLKANGVWFIDHHKTAIDDLEGLGDLYDNFYDHSNIEQSGAYLAWNFVHGRLVTTPSLILHIQDRDLWKFEIPNTREVTAFLYSVPFNFNDWDNYAYSYAYHDSMVIAGKTLLAMQAKNIKTILNNGITRITLDGYNVPCVNCPEFMKSDIGDILNKNELFSVTYFDTPGKRIYSLRSDKNSETSINVGDIAKKMGGGGHDHAAGFMRPVFYTTIE